MLSAVQDLQRLRDQPQILAYGIEHAGGGEQAEGDGVDQRPADEVGKRGQRLHDVFEPSAFDFVQEYREEHRQERSRQPEDTHGKGVLHDRHELLDLRGIAEQGGEPFESHKFTLGEAKWRPIVIQRIDPAMEREIGEQETEDQKRQDQKKHLPAFGTVLPVLFWNIRFSFRHNRLPSVLIFLKYNISFFYVSTREIRGDFSNYLSIFSMTFKISDFYHECSLLFGVEMKRPVVNNNKHIPKR